MSARIDWVTFDGQRHTLNVCDVYALTAAASVHRQAPQYIAIIAAPFAWEWCWAPTRIPGCPCDGCKGVSK